MSIDPRLYAVASAQPYPLVFATISGAHLYGFPSIDSDFDLRGVHILPVREVIGLDTGPGPLEVSEIRDGLDLDLVTHDVAKFCTLLLKRNGYVLEQLYSPLVVAGGDSHDELKAIAAGCITRNHAHHYLGFADTQWALYEKQRQLKPLLYVFRVLKTGIRLMRTGRIEANLGHLLDDEPRVPYLGDLIAAKQRDGEHTAAKETASSAPAPTALAEDNSPVELSLLLHERTFADLVAVTRKWGSGVERYPKAFSPLEEEILSSLLVPALNVAFDTAQREVFSVEGRTDIFVEAVRGNRENAAFFGEAKVWGGKSEVQDALGQLLRYSNGRTSEVMLLYYVKRRRLQLIQSRCRKALEDTSEFVRWMNSEEIEVAIVGHPDYGQDIAVTQVFIHIPHDGAEAPDIDDLEEGGA